MNGSPSSFRHYWLTLQLVFFCMYRYASLCLYTGHSFHDRKFQFVTNLTRIEEDFSKGLIEVWLNCESSHVIQRDSRIHCFWICEVTSHSTTYYCLHDIACTSFTLHKRAVITRDNLVLTYNITILIVKESRCAESFSRKQGNYRFMSYVIQNKPF